MAVAVVVVIWVDTSVSPAPVSRADTRTARSDVRSSFTQIETWPRPSGRTVTCGTTLTMRAVDHW